MYGKQWTMRAFHAHNCETCLSKRFKLCTITKSRFNKSIQRYKKDTEIARTFESRGVFRFDVFEEGNEPRLFMKSPLLSDVITLWYSRNLWVCKFGFISHSLMPFTPSWHVGQQRVPSTSGDPLPWIWCPPRSSPSPLFPSQLSVAMWS